MGIEPLWRGVDDRGEILSEKKFNEYDLFWQIAKQDFAVAIILTFISQKCEGTHRGGPKII